jgi:hypothetical protein
MAFDTAINSGNGSKPTYEELPRAGTVNILKQASKDVLRQPDAKNFSTDICLASSCEIAIFGGEARMETQSVFQPVRDSGTHRAAGCHKMPGWLAARWGTT